VRLHGDERGFKGVELGMGLLLVGILAAMAIPLMSKISDRVGEVAAAAETRTRVIEEALDPAAGVEVAGVQLERSADGATCRWTQSAAGAVYGVWQSGSESLYGVFDAKPEVCPTAARAAAVGFGPSFVAP
jgi:Tfp pilus assembly protein FimT